MMGGGMNTDQKMPLLSRLLQQQLSENQQPSQLHMQTSQQQIQQQLQQQSQHLGSIVEGSQNLFQQAPSSVFSDDSSQQSFTQPAQQLLLSQQQNQQPSFVVDQQQFMLLEQQQSQLSNQQHQQIPMQQNQLIQLVNQSDENSTQHQQQNIETFQQQLQQKPPFIIQLPPGFQILRTDQMNTTNESDNDTNLPSQGNNNNQSVCQNNNTNIQHQNIQQITQQSNMQQIAQQITQQNILQHNNNNQDNHIDTTNDNISIWKSNISAIQPCSNNNNKPTFKMPQKHQSPRLRQIIKCSQAANKAASESSSSSSPPLASAPSQSRVFNMKNYIQVNKAFKEPVKKNLLNASSFEKKRRIRVRGCRGVEKDLSKASTSSNQSPQPSIHPSIHPSFPAPSPISTCHRSLRKTNSGIDDAIKSESSNDALPPCQLGTNLKSSQHKTAEQMRRFSIKCGLNALNETVPSLCRSTGCRVSKTTTLNKTVNYIKKLKDERKVMEDEIERLKAEKNLCEREIKMYQDQLPASGMPNKSCLQSPAHQQQLHTSIKHYVHRKAEHNNKFWIFLLLIEPLFTSLKHLLSSADVGDFSRALFGWLNERCSLVSLRPMFSNSLRRLSTSTCILVHPEAFEGQVRDAIQQAIHADSLPLNPLDHHTSNQTSPHDPMHSSFNSRECFNSENASTVPLNKLSWRL